MLGIKTLLAGAATLLLAQLAAAANKAVYAHFMVRCTPSRHYDSV
jgi:hypothetical protein